MKILSFLLIAFLIPQMVYGKFSHESELSTIITGGNSELETYNAKMTNGYEKEKWKLTFGGHYTYGKANEIESARNWDVNLRYDRILSEKLSVFLGEIVEGDKFSGYMDRWNTDVGAAYILYKGKKNKTFGELGYRLTLERQEGSGDRSTEHKARVYAETATQHNENLNTKLWAEYIPNFTVDGDFLLTFEPSLGLKLSKIFSLKVAFKGIYDQKPAVEGNKKFDSIYTTSLIAKF